MKEIKELSEMIEEELEGACDYAKQAVVLKDLNPDSTLAKTFYDISLDEMRHVNMLHDEVKRIIEKHHREHGEPPAPMMAVYEYLHNRHIEKANEIKAYQAQYKGI
jgi:Mn-containing catalase